MSAPQSLIQAALNRLQARIGSGLADSVAGLAVLAQEAPERLRSEWELFWQEVEMEAERLETDSEDHVSSPPAAATGHPSQPERSSQERIDDLRAAVAALTRRLEDRA